MSAATREEWMTVTAARLLPDRCVCFVGIGLPSAACNLARQTHAPKIVLIYESGTIGARPNVLPLSIGDGELAETAACVVPLPEIFSYYLQAGRVDVGFLGAAQIDRYGNLNSTVIGEYDRPTTRLPGAGGAPEIALHARQTFVMLKASPRSFVRQLDFCTSAGFLDGSGKDGYCADGSSMDGSSMDGPSMDGSGLHTRARGGGPRAVITDFGVLTPHPQTLELQLTGLFADASPEEARAAVGWELTIADRLDTIAAPDSKELASLRALNQRTREAHARAVRIPLDGR